MEVGSAAPADAGRPGVTAARMPPPCDGTPHALPALIVALMRPPLRCSVLASRLLPYDATGDAGWFVLPGCKGLLQAASASTTEPKVQPASSASAAIASKNSCSSGRVQVAEC